MVKCKQINIPTIPRIPVHKSTVTVMDLFLLLMALSHGHSHKLLLLCNCGARKAHATMRLPTTLQARVTNAMPMTFLVNKGLWYLPFHGAW